ncbi:pentatricopeptide repeat (PPR) superfamily protein [Striga asiatica]|uniref:Pentatricopeptide repeat (PPR) superfamily protein n=1 Tax=Striga asiatica TaxID=4170 RepID=A0A5A7QAM6_STRAF|nr:pentatricopeptide repeat (PPR) superfamily protein [Striga asiatica]
MNRRLCTAPHHFRCRQKPPFSPNFKISTNTHTACFYSTKLSHASILHQLKHTKPIHQVHAQLIISNLSKDVFLCNRLVNAYASCGHVPEARIVFSKIPNKNLVSWTVLLSGLAKNGLFLEAIDIFREMVRGMIKPNEVTIASVLPAFGKLGFFLLGKSVHCYWVRHNFGDNVFVGTGLISMYSKFGSVENAREVFDKMSVRNVVSWNAMISCYAENGFEEDALLLFSGMRMKGFSIDIFTLMSLISLREFRVGSGVHGLIVKRGYYENDRLVKTALMELYIDCGFVDNAYFIFGEISKRDLVSWTLMLRGFTKSGNWKKTLGHFIRMMREDDIKFDSISLATILSGCSSSGALQQGRCIHAIVTKSGFQGDFFIGSAIIDMYTNCASIRDGERYFDSMGEKDVACWNALISGYGSYGCGVKAVELFSKMKFLEINPNESTFVSVLCACSHAGLVDIGLEIFGCMMENRNVIPNAKHYACVVDLLGRAGRINDAYSLVKRMNQQPRPEVYCSLLAACRAHRNFELGDEISRELFQLKPVDAGHYVLLSNVYALAGKWEYARTSRKYLKSSELKKRPGISSIEIKGEIFTFMASQTDHPFYLEIKELLVDLISKIRAAGFEFDLDSVFLDVSDDVKKDILFHHSEKLAIAFGLLRTKPEFVIRITKNLRVCNDCHAASKFVSKVYGRVLVIKDANRFHIFKDGQCSCGDWW